LIKANKFNEEVWSSIFITPESSKNILKELVNDGCSYVLKLKDDNFEDIKNIFLCSGGRDIISKDIYTNDLSKIFLLCPIIKDKQYLEYKKCYDNRDNTEIYGYGFISFIQFKKDYLLEMAFDADFALVKAWKGDTLGNLIFKDTARNFNPLMAMAGKITIAEVEELVPAGELDPNQIHTPGIYVHRIFEGKQYEKRIEQLTEREQNPSSK
jgi:hypothetical protein